MKSSCRKNLEVFKVRYFISEHACPLRDRMLEKVQTTIEFISGPTTTKLSYHKRVHIPNDVIKDVISSY